MKFFVSRVTANAATLHHARGLGKRKTEGGTVASAALVFALQDRARQSAAQPSFAKPVLRIFRVLLNLLLLHLVRTFLAERLQRLACLAAQRELERQLLQQ